MDERTDGDTVVFTVVVPEDCPFFEGHFPGRPVLPAIGQLAMLTALVQRVTGPSVSLTGVDGFRLSRQVLPGDRVEVRLEALRAGDTAAFDLLFSSDEPITGIFVSVSTPGNTISSVAGEGLIMASGFLPALGVPGIEPGGDIAGTWGFASPTSNITAYTAIKIGSFTVVVNANGAVDIGFFRTGDVVGDVNFSPIVPTFLSGQVNVPEPATAMLLGLGLVGLAVAGRKSA